MAGSTARGRPARTCARARRARWHLAAEMLSDGRTIASRRRFPAELALLVRCEDAIESLIERLCFGAPDPTLGQLVWEHVSSGGKRLRARLALRAVEALGGTVADGIAWGACCELLHNASLIHDDVEDGDRYRRGRLALWARHGTAQAINAGDLAIALSYLAIGAVPVSDGLRWRLTESVSRAARRVVDGQAAELRLLAAAPLTWEAYATCVEGKTTALFALPIEGAALIAGRSADDAARLASGFRPLGLLFQIQDDLVDLYGDNGRDRPGSDLAQLGKATALVVEHLRLHPEDRAWLLAILTAPRADTAPETIDAAIARFAEQGALAAVWQRIDDLLGGLDRAGVLAGEPGLGALIDGFVVEALRPVAHTRPRIG